MFPRNTQLSMIGALAAAMLASTAAHAQVSDDIVKIGVLTDMNGPASTPTGQGSVTAAQMAVDDFGVGYSSLSFLQRLPADELKLDRSFLRRTDGGPQHEEFLGALVRLARAAGLSVLAEGVETTEDLAAVAVARCQAAKSAALK